MDFESFLLNFNACDANDINQAGTLLVLKKLEGEEEEKTVNEVNFFKENPNSIQV